jgi:hypothetical protein
MARREPSDPAAIPPRDGGGELVASAEPGGEGLRFAGRFARRALEVFLYWMPVWVPLILLAQLGVRGLRPARLEDERLRGHESELEGRLEEDRSEARALRRQLDALHDDIYLERLRRRRAAEQQREIEERGLAPSPPADGEQER